MRRVAGILLGILVAASAASAADPFDTALTQARANEASPEWEAYRAPFFQALGPVLQRAMQKCFPESPEPKETLFTIVFIVREDGTLAERMARPESPAATCTLEALASVQVPKPPRPDWWGVLDMKVKR
jgi:hypothetical protein